MRVINNNTEYIMDCAFDLVKSIDDFSNSLPVEEIYGLRERLNYAAGLVPEKLSVWLESGGKIQATVNLIKTNSLIKEIYDYVKLAEELKFAGTEGIKYKIGKFTDVLRENEAFFEI